MDKGLLKSEYLSDLDEELTNLDLISDYLYKSNRTDVEFSQLRNLDNLTLIDGGVKIPEIITMREASGRTDIFRKSSKTHSSDEIDELSKKTGLERKDIIDLIQDGMQLEEISVAADNLPFKEISESSAIREMIRSEIEPTQLQALKTKGIEVVAMTDGSLQISNLEKIAQLDEKGMVQLEPELEQSLEPFEQMGLLTISKGLVVKEIEPDQKEIVDGKRGSLEVVPLDEKKQERTKEELEREEIAKKLGTDPQEIISVIRIEDREGGSRLFNDSLTQKSKPLIIRLRNNNFKLMEEKDDGTKEELQGFEATPVSKQVASLLKDTAHNHDTYIRPGEIKAGKTNNNQERYNIFQIRRAGESIDDDSNYLLFAGFSGETDLSLIENRTNGSMAFAEVPQSRYYPRSIYMEGTNKGVQEKEVVKGNDNPQEDIPMESSINYNDIDKKISLLTELREVENKIREIEIETETGHDERCASTHYNHSHEKSNDDQDLVKDEAGDNQDSPDISDSLADNSRKLPGLYSRRGELLQELGASPSDSVEQIEEEYVIGSKRRPF